MIKSLWVALVSAALVTTPVLAGEKRKTAAKKQVETGASCKAPAVGRCAACSIMCRTGETAQCGGALAIADACQTQPTCKCSK